MKEIVRLKSSKILIYSYVFIFIICGTIRSHFSISLFYHPIIDIVNISLLIAFYIFGLLKKREYAFSIYKADIVFLFVISLPQSHQLFLMSM